MVRWGLPIVAQRTSPHHASVIHPEWWGRRGVGLDNPQRSLPTPTILWFCDLYSHLTQAALGLLELHQTVIAPQLHCASIRGRAWLPLALLPPLLSASRTAAHPPFPATLISAQSHPSSYVLCKALISPQRHRWVEFLFDIECKQKADVASSRSFPWQGRSLYVDQINCLTSSLLITAWQSVATCITVFTTRHYHHHHLNLLLRGANARSLEAGQNKKTPQMTERWRWNTFEQGKLPSLAWGCAAPCVHLGPAARSQEVPESAAE